MGITPCFLSLIDPDDPADPVRRQIVPRAQEAANLSAGSDAVSDLGLERVFDDIHRTPAIRDGVVSGGDPLTFATERLDRILGRLRAIPHVETIRIGSRVPIECYPPGVEVTVGVCGADEDARVIGAMEIAPVRVGTGEFIYGLGAKRNYQEDVRYHAPPLTLDERQRADAEASALAACRALGCRDIARVDLRFDAAGEANLVEVNPIPGLNPVSSGLVIMNGLLGSSYQALIGLILDAALKRLSVAGICATASRQALTWP